MTEPTDKQIEWARRLIRHATGAEYEDEARRLLAELDRQGVKALGSPHVALRAWNAGQWHLEAPICPDAD